MHNQSFTQLIACMILASLFNSASLWAADKPSTVAPKYAKRPKVCLVLSGGGARGAAHIGVIKVLEELRVPIDCIAATSMGSLVGGAYASGLNIAQMEAVVNQLSTAKILRATPPRKELNIRRKQEDRTLLFSPELGIASINGSLLPKGLVSGDQLKAIFRDLAAPGYINFDELPIAYRAVATDLVTGKAVIFDKGVMADVMRASMSVPVAIAPAEIDGKILVDGMLVNNLPVDVARAMGADVIIAVNVGTPLLKREELGSVLGVAGQMIQILTEQNVQNALALLKESDILISPELGAFSTTDFDHLADTLPKGEAAAHKVSQQLLKLSLSVDQYAQLRKQQSTQLAQVIRPIDEIRFEKMQLVNPAITAKMMGTEIGKPVDQKILDKDMRKIYGRGDFEQVNYNFMDVNGRNILNINAVEKSWGPNYYRFGLGLQHDFQGDSDFTLNARFRKPWVNSLGAEWLTDVQIGRVDRIFSEFYQPIDYKQRFFVAPMVEVKRSTTNLYSDSTRIARYELDRYRVGIDIGTAIQQYGEIRLGVRKGVLKPSLDIGPQALSPGANNIAEGAFTANVLFDQLDSVTFPRDGLLASAYIYDSNTALGADDSYTKWGASGAFVNSFGKNTFSLIAEAGSSLGNALPNYDQHQFGGFLRQSGYRNGQLIGGSFSRGELLYYRKLIDSAYLQGVYAGFSLEVGKLNDPLVANNPTELLKSAAVFLASDSPIGPIYLGYGRSADGNGSLYLHLGFFY